MPAFRDAETMNAGKVVWLVLLLLGGIFTTIGVLIGLVVGKPILDNARATEQWPQAGGEVLESRLDESRGENGTMYSAHVVYRYALDGGEFESNRIWFGGDYSTSDRSEMFEIVRQYPVGKQVTVYYSPDEPSESVLIPGAFVLSHLLYVIGLVFLAIGGVLLLVLVFLVVRSVTGPGGDPQSFQDSFAETTRQSGEG